MIIEWKKSIEKSFHDYKISQYGQTEYSFCEQFGNNPLPISRSIVFFSKKRSSLFYVTNIFGIVAQCKDDTYESNGRVVLV